jgi:hypothetical protein
MITVRVVDLSGKECIYQTKYLNFDPGNNTERNFVGFWVEGEYHKYEYGQIYVIDVCKYDLGKY